MVEIAEIIRAEGSVGHWSRPTTVEVGARAAWDYFLAEEQAKPVFDRRIPALMFYGRTDRPYWFMQFLNREIEKITPAEIKAAKARTKRLLQRAIFKRAVTIETDEAMLRVVKHVLVEAAELLEQAADMKEQRDANPKDKTKNRWENSPPPEFTRANASRLLRMALQLG